MSHKFKVSVSKKHIYDLDRKHGITGLSPYTYTMEKEYGHTWCCFRVTDLCAYFIVETETSGDEIFLLLSTDFEKIND